MVYCDELRITENRMLVFARRRSTPLSSHECHALNASLQSQRTVRQWHSAEQHAYLVSSPHQLFPEDRFEHAPYVIGDWVIAGFARLDNRALLIMQLDLNNNNVSDTEILAYAWHQWGKEGLNRIYGDFTLIAWHISSQTLHIAVDHLSHTHLYYYQDSDNLVVSTLRAPLLTQIPTLRRINTGALLTLLTARFPETDPWQDIQHVPAGHVMSFEHNGITYYSKLNVSAFTARANAIVVDDKLPEPASDKEYLIIDEVHQLVKRKMTRGKFFAKDVNPSYDYKSFILSGTLSNLTTTEWYNYITLMGQSFGTSMIDGQTPKSLESAVKTETSRLKQRIAESAENLAIEQRRYFDPEALNMGQTSVTDEKKPSNKLEMFNMLYASKILELRDETRPLQEALISKDYTIRFDDSISSTPNFELFYQLVGQSAITAQSTQIAEELFGEQQKQHNADVINAPSPLTIDDIALLRALHQITRDYNVYKSMAIATKINNAILNLNDGLSNKNIYDILTKYAASNTRFLEYLATLDVNILEKLPKSGLINQPILTETPKFKILQDILKSEPDETHLIVVNDEDAMIKLSKALNVDSLTKSQVNNPLDYQDSLDEMFEKQSVVVVPQMMIKSSLDIIQANRLIQYQLNTEISDIIQTQNRINRIGQTRETKAYYIATDVLQKNIIDLFLETYKNIRVAHKGIVELFVDMSSQVNVVNDYISKAMQNIETTDANADVDVDEYIPSFNDDGTMNLFDVSEIETIELEDNQENQEVIIEHYDNPEQMFLFSPLDIALCHQLTPAA